MKDFRPGTQRFGEACGASRHDHEFLDVDRIVGVHAAIDDVHHRHRQGPRCRAADIAVERQLVGSRCRLGGGERHAENGIGTEAALVGRAVESDHGFVDLDLGFGVHAAERVEEFAVDRFDRAAHALAEIALLVAVAELDRLVRSGRGAGRHGGAAARAVGQNDVDLHGRIAAAVENFAADNVDNGGHARSRKLKAALLQDRLGTCHAGTCHVAPSGACKAWRYERNSPIGRHPNPCPRKRFSSVVRP